MPDDPPTPPENQQRTLVASLIEQAKNAGLKVRWHNADIVVIGIVKTEPNKEISDNGLAVVRCIGRSPPN